MLHNDPVKAAQMMCNAHVVKMVTESAQMLSTVHRIINGKETRRLSNSGLTNVKHWELPYPMEDVLMKACHVNHPCTQWARESDSNYMWLYEHYRALSDEYTYRYGKKHGAFYKNEIGFVLKNPPSNITMGNLTHFRTAMKQYPECIVDSVVESYRNYYKVAKKDFAKWTKREQPIWWSEAT